MFRQFAELRSACSGKSVRVTLRVPDAEEQCPLTLSPIAEDELDFLPGETFVQAVPNCKKLELPCGHAFGAMKLVYHFARRDMRCPCCRAGHKDTLDIDCVPRHFRERLRNRVDLAERQDREEQYAADEAVARQMSAEAGGFISEMAASLPVSMSVYFHSGGVPGAPVASMEFSLLSNLGHDSEGEFALVRPHPNASPHGVTYYFMPDVARRVLSEMLQDRSITNISIVAHMRSPATGGVVELARTPPFPVREPSCPYTVTRVIRATNDTYFDVSTEHEPWSLQCIVWRLAPPRPRTVIAGVLFVVQ